MTDQDIKKYGDKALLSFKSSDYYKKSQKDRPLSGADSLFSSLIPFRGLWKMGNDVYERGRKRLLPKAGIGDKLTVQQAYKQSDVDWNAVQDAVNRYLLSDTSKSRLKLRPDTLAYVDERLKQEGWNEYQRNAALGNIIIETQGRPSLGSQTGPTPTYYGMLQWSKERMPVRTTGMQGLDDQIDQMIKEKESRKYWSGQADGTYFKNDAHPFNIFNGIVQQDMPKEFNILNTPQNQHTWSYTMGLIRPGSGSTKDERSKRRLEELLMRSMAAKAILNNRKKKK